MSIVLTDAPEQWIWVDGPEKSTRYPWKVVLGSIVIARTTTKTEAQELVKRTISLLRGTYNTNKVLTADRSVTSKRPAVKKRTVKR